MGISREYLAGFVDGEGSIMIVKSGRPRADGVQVSFSATLMIANTHRQALEAIQGIYGGRIDSNGKPHNPKWKQGWSLIWKGPAAASLISALRPHLLIKREQADVALAFVELQKSSYRRLKSEADVEAANDCYRSIRALNARGPVAAVAEQFR